MDQQRTSRPDVAPDGQAGGGSAEFADALLGFLAAARRTRGRYQPLLHDVTVPQLVLLDAVQACGDDGISAVAAYTALTQPTVTQQAAALERAGWVRRSPADHDGRRRRLRLTASGQDMLDAKRAQVARHLATAWGELDAAEQALAVPLLRHLATLVEQLV